MSAIVYVKSAAVLPLLQRSKGRFVSVTFAKKNGELSTRVVQPQSAPFHLVAKPSQASKAATETRAERHPTLTNQRTARGKWISFDVTRVQTMQRNGVTYIVDDVLADLG